MRLLWDQLSDPRLGAVYQAYAAARTDPGVQGAMEPAIRWHSVAMHQPMYEVVGDREDRWVIARNHSHQGWKVEHPQRDSNPCYLRERQAS